VTEVLEVGAPRLAARRAAVMVHGRGRDAEEMASLALRFGDDAMRAYCPRAPGRTWYPASFLEPLESNQPQLDASLADIVALVDRLCEEGFDDSQIVLCGFSQGACMIAELIRARPADYAAALIFTGGLIGPPGTSWAFPARLEGLPVLLTGCRTDAWVPDWRTRETRDAFAANGAKVEMAIYDDRPHEVCDDEIARARALLATRFEPGAGRR